MKKIFLLIAIITALFGIIVLNGCVTLSAYSTGILIHGSVFDFSAGGYDDTNGDIETIGWNPTSNVTGNIYLRNGYTPYDPAAIKDYGAVTLTSITSVVASQIVTSNAPAMVQNHVYVLKTKEGNYAKFIVTNLPDPLSTSWNVSIEYYYQSDGSTTFSQ